MKNVEIRLLLYRIQFILENKIFEYKDSKGLDDEILSDIFDIMNKVFDEHRSYEYDE